MPALPFQPWGSSSLPPFHISKCLFQQWETWPLWSSGGCVRCLPFTPTSTSSLSPPSSQPLPEAALDRARLPASGPSGSPWGLARRLEGGEERGPARWWRAHWILSQCSGQVAYTWPSSASAWAPRPSGLTMRRPPCCQPWCLITPPWSPWTLRALLINNALRNSLQTLALSMFLSLWDYDWCGYCALKKQTFPTVLHEYSCKLFSSVSLNHYLFVYSHLIHQRGWVWNQAWSLFKAFISWKYKMSWVRHLHGNTLVYGLGTSGCQVLLCWFHAYRACAGSCVFPMSSAQTRPWGLDSCSGSVMCPYFSSYLKVYFETF